MTDPVSEVAAASVQIAVPIERRTSTLVARTRAAGRSSICYVAADHDDDDTAADHDDDVAAATTSTSTTTAVPTSTSTTTTVLTSTTTVAGTTTTISASDSRRSRPRPVPRHPVSEVPGNRVAGTPRRVVPFRLRVRTVARPCVWRPDSSLPAQALQSSG